MEMELKLVMAPAALARLKRVAWLRDLAGGQASGKRLLAVYYDTPERDLRRAGLVFRVRREGRKWVQCVKGRAGGDSVLLAREEHERTSSSSRPDLAWLAEMVGTRVAPEVLLGIEPLFTCRVNRRSRVLTLGENTKVEMAFDSGTIEAGKRSTGVSELELELLEGEPGPLLELAERIAADVPCRLGTRGKADMGFALADGEERPVWQSAPKIQLAHKASLEALLVAWVQAMVRQLQVHEDCVSAAAHPEGVHQMRVAVRRLRSILSLLRRVLPAEMTAPLAEDLKWLGSQLGPARDLDVFLTEILAPVREAMPDVADLEGLHSRAKSRLKRAYGKARKALRDPRYTRLLLRLTAWTETRPWREQPADVVAILDAPSLKFARRLLTKRQKQVVGKGKGFKSLDEEARHEVRLQAKKLRYAADFFRSVYSDSVTKRYLRVLGRLQRELGRANDIVTARSLSTSLARTAPAEVQAAAGVVIGWHERGLTEHEPDLRQAWKRFRRCRPFWE